MINDNAIVKWGEMKHYTEDVKEFVKNEGGGGGVKSLSDLGITITASTINGLPTKINNLGTTIDSVTMSTLLYSMDLTLSMNSSNDADSHVYNTYIDTSTFTVLGGYVLTNLTASSWSASADLVKMCSSFAQYNGYWYVCYQLPAVPVYNVGNFKYRVWYKRR